MFSFYNLKTGEINRQGGSYDSDYFLVLVGVSRPLYDIIFYFSDRTLYSYYFVLSCRHICNILYGFCVEYSVLLSLGRINISCFLFPVSCFLFLTGFAAFGFINRSSNVQRSSKDAKNAKSFKANKCF